MSKLSALLYSAGCLFLALILPGAALSATIHVPSDQPTIQAGIDAAKDDDTVSVSAGLYQGPGNRDITFDGKLLTVIAEDGPETTTIDCQGSELDQHRGFDFFEEPVGAVLEGFRIINGYADEFENDEDRGGGIRILDSAIKVIDCVVEYCYATSGSISIHKSPESVIERTRVSHHLGQFEAFTGWEMGSIIDCEFTETTMKVPFLR